ESGQIEDVPAPQLAIEYYNLPSEAKLSDMIQRVRADEQHHADVNLRMAGGRTSEDPSVSTDASHATSAPNTPGARA
ncbi:MAG: alternative oxidase, partial [Pseudomonadota bacterium]|nr:alternative oxidase [Pseudomonadota bacterium]